MKTLLNLVRIIKEDIAHGAAKEYLLGLEETVVDLLLEVEAMLGVVTQQEVKVLEADMLHLHHS